MAGKSRASPARRPGQPFTVYDTAADFSGFNQSADRPDIIGSGTVDPEQLRNPDAAFNTSYFSAIPPTGRRRARRGEISITVPAWSTGTSLP